MTTRSLLALDDVPALALFVDVVATGSLSGAARHCGLTTSAVSKRIAQLEHRLGVRLLNRTTRRIAPTDAGLRLERHAARMLRELQDTEVELMDLGRLPRGVLRVATSVSFGQMHIGVLASEFVAKHPDVTIELSLDEAFVDLVARRFDVAIRCGQMPDSSLTMRRLAPKRRLVCGSPDYLARRGVPLRPEDLTQHDCLCHGLDDAGRSWTFGDPAEPVRVRVAGSLHSDNPLVLRDAAVHGVGLVWLPNFVVAADVRAGRLRVVLEEFTIDHGSVYAAYPPGPQPPRLVRAFVAHLAERLPALLDPGYQRPAVDPPSTASTTPVTKRASAR